MLTRIVAVIIVVVLRGFSAYGHNQTSVHPEWIALKNGKRQIQEKCILNQLCLSNRSMRDAVLKEMQEHIRKTREHPVPPRLFDFSLNDAPSVCECDDCAEIVQRHGNDTGLLLDFVNFIADAVAKDYPDVMISTLAYLNTEHVPQGVIPARNVLIVLCDTKSTYTAPIAWDGYFAQRLKEWSQVTSNIYVWDYHIPFVDWALPLPYEPTFQADLQLFRKYNVIDMMTEFHYPVFGEMRDLRLWLLAKLCEDPYQDQNRLIATFTDGFYGPAAEPVREYLQLLQDAARSAPSYAGPNATAASLAYLTPEFILRAQGMFDRADLAVNGMPVYRRRVRHARLGVDKATLAIYPRIWAQWSSGEQDTADLPWTREQIAARMRDTVEEQWRLRAGDVSASFESLAARDKKMFLDAIDAYLQKKLIIIDLPEKFAHLPPEWYTDYPADSVVPYEHASLVEDADAQTGIAVRADLTEATLVKMMEREGSQPRFPAEDVLRWDLHDYTTPSGNDDPSIRRLAAAQVQGPGYHWYKLGRYRLGQNNFLWVYEVGLEVSLRNAVDPLDVAAEHELWARIKFIGPAFPHGTAEEPNAIYVERVVALKEK